MNEPEGILLLATSVSQGLKCVETFTKSHRHRRITRVLFQRILSVNANFQDMFGATPVGTGTGGGRLWPIISEGDSVPGELLLEDDIKVKLGRYYYRLRCCLQDAKSVLDDITSILGAGDNEGGDLVSGTLDPADGKLVLEKLVGELTTHINDAITFRRSALCPPTTPGNGEQRGRAGSSWISWLSGPAIAPVAILISFFTSRLPGFSSKQSGSKSPTASTAQCALPKSETNRTTLTELYNVLSHELRCRCHFAHLGLCSASVDPPESGSLGGAGNPGSICSLFITLDLSTLMARYVDKDPIYFRISRPRSGNGNGTQPISTLPQSPTGHSTCCSRITTSPLGSKHSLRCEPPSRTEFLLESARPPPAGTPLKSPTYKPVLTLRDILAPHPQEGNTIKLWEEDRLRLAAKLARWVRLHYDTPWLGDLNSQKIRFFRRYEDNPNHANWTPYISASFERTPDPCGKNSGGLYALGLVLLELGLSKPPDHSPGDDRAWAARIASRGLLRTLGKRYQRIVEKLLAEGEEEAGRMEGGQIDDLEGEIMLIIQSLN